MATREVTLRLDADRLVDLLDGYCGPRNIQDLYKCLEDPCKDGHRKPNCMVLDYEAIVSPELMKRISRAGVYGKFGPSLRLYEQRESRIERKVDPLKDWQPDELVRLITDRWVPANGVNLWDTLRWYNDPFTNTRKQP